LLDLGKYDPDADVRGRVLTRRKRTLIQLALHLDGLVADEFSRRSLDPARIDSDWLDLADLLELPHHVKRHQPFTERSLVDGSHHRGR
jgi:hypothetical protein